MVNKKISRRRFLKTSMLGAAAASFLKTQITQAEVIQTQAGNEWPDAERLGRNCTGGMINMRLRPNAESESVKTLYEDSIVVWLREVVGEAPSGVYNKRWVETPDGYLYLPCVQPVNYQPNKPVQALPQTAEGSGMWVEVTVPYVDIILEKAPCSFWLQEIQ